MLEIEQDNRSITRVLHGIVGNVEVVTELLLGGGNGPPQRCW